VESGDKRLSGAHFVSANEGWLVGEAGTILHTADGGTTWERQSAPSDSYLVHVTCADARHCWVWGDRALLRTADGGRRWEREAFEAECQPRSAQFLDPDRGYLACGASLLRTQDSGRSWTEIPVVLDEQEADTLTALRFVDDNNGWVATEHRVARTADGGASWEVTLRDDGVVFWGLVSHDGWTVYAATAGSPPSLNGGAYWSQDGGRTWQDVLDPDESPNDWEWSLHVSAGPLRRLRL